MLLKKLNIKRLVALVVLLWILALLSVFVFQPDAAYLSEYCEQATTEQCDTAMFEGKF